MRFGEYESRDLPSTNCEIHIDKVRSVRSSGGVILIKPYIKVNPEKLDGRITKVSFYGRQSTLDYNSPVQPVDSDWNEIAMRGFLGARDYFELANNNDGFAISSNYGSAKYEGGFYVETEHGTRYWANAGIKKNFVFNYASMAKIVDDCWSNYNCSDMSSVKTTAELNLEDLNPQHCR